MNNQEINIAIAEACGWTRQRSPLQSKDDPEPKGWVSPKGKGNYWKTVDRVPDYCNDLNAMHEAEKVLVKGGLSEQISAYSIHLNRIVNETTTKAWWDLTAIETFCVSHATSRQRAEAFLKTLGKWREEV